tara:strand:+ start:2275 stop:2676 length:402 start_codon:yes stop_codon:yes gene_type:complete
MSKLSIRRALNPFLSLFDWFFRPRPVVRTEQESRKLAKATSAMALYDYKGCSASRKARREIYRLSLEIERRDIGKCMIHQDNLLAEYGKLKAPCLRVEEKGVVIWLDEPEAIVHFLNERFDTTSEDLHKLKSA